MPGSSHVVVFNLKGIALKLFCQKRFLIFCFFNLKVLLLIVLLILIGAMAEYRHPVVVETLNNLRPYFSPEKLLFLQQNPNSSYLVRSGEFASCQLKFSFYLSEFQLCYFVRETSFSLQFYHTYEELMAEYQIYLANRTTRFRRRTSRPS